jgi:tetratricopeptide (TPR) repeat protein
MPSFVEAKKPLPTHSRFTRKRPAEIAPENTDVTTGDNIDSDAEFCHYLLINGFVQSYVDFYHLTHRLDTNVAQGAEEKKIYTSRENMRLLSKYLVEAEVSRREGNTNGVYNAYNMLSEIYIKLLDWKTAIFFQEKYVDVALLTSDKKGEMNANHSLGVIHQRMGEWDTARRMHEHHESIAAELEIASEIVRSNSELYKTYNELAHQIEDANDVQGALEIYHKCLSAAEKSEELTSEGEANGHIGRILLDLGQPAEAVPFLKHFSEIATDLGDAQGRCTACSGLALAYDQLGFADKALRELKLVHNISEQSGEVALQSQACKALGTLYSKIGEKSDSVTALQRHFELIKFMVSKKAGPGPAAKAPDETKSSSSAGAGVGAGTSGTGATGATATEQPLTSVQDMDLARVFVGISKGNLYLDAYGSAVNEDMQALLEWKLNRVDFTLPTPPEPVSEPVPEPGSGLAAEDAGNTDSNQPAEAESATALPVN